MATLNLGRIKPVFRGAYSGSTAYVVDDIVTSGGSSYICIQAHGAGTQAVTQTAYWSVLASTGTDVGTTITTQGDILYRDGSGLARLAAGTSGQLLQSGGSGANVSWTNAPSGKVKQIQTMTNNTQTTTTSTTWSATPLTLAITPTSSSSKIMIMCQLGGTFSGANDYQVETSIYRGTTNLATAGDRMMLSRANSSNIYSNQTFIHSDSPNTTSATTYTIYFSSERAGDTSAVNYNNTQSTLTLWEYVN